MSVLRSALPRSSPSAQGVSPAGIKAFVQAWEQSAARGISEPHSLMVLRQGQVVAETWWAPYRVDAPQHLYSISKTVAAFAVGLAVEEGRLSVADPVVSFFPDKLPKIVSPHLELLSVSDLLTMTAGHGSDPTFAVAQQEDWVQAFLELPLPHRPGTVFVYNSAATYMLSAIVQKLTGMTMLDYLEPRLFAPLGARGQRWEVCPRGVNVGGWGLSATTETVAKLGQLCLQRGLWNGTRLLPRDWIDASRTLQAQQSASWSFAGPPDPVPQLSELQTSSDYHQGYGYQVWLGRHDSYRAEGALGQFMVILPSLDAVIVMTGESSDTQALLSLVWEHLLPALEGAADRTDGDPELKPYPSSKALAGPVGHRTSPLADHIGGRCFALEANAFGADSLSFRFDGELCVIQLRHGSATSVIESQAKVWFDTETDLPGSPPGLFRAFARAGGSSVLACAHAWTDERTLVLKMQFYETPHHDTMTCRFAGDAVEVRMLNSVSAAFAERFGDASPFPERRSILKGVAKHGR